jgi:uncharacterized protein
MHPDYLPTHTGLARTSNAVVRVLLFPLLRLLWTAALLVLLSMALFRLAPSLRGLPNQSLGGAARNAALLLAVLFLSVHLFEGKTLASVGLGVKGAPAVFGLGLLLGALALSASTAVLFLANGYRIDGLGAGASPDALGHAALLFFLVALFEEGLSRAVVFRLLEQGLGTWAALGLSALLFGFLHTFNPGATVLSSVAIALEAGVLLGAAYVASRSLWLPIGLHTAWNFFEGPVYGAPVSGIPFPSLFLSRFPGPAWLTGGAFGPEAGLPTVLIGSGLGLAFLLLAARRRQLFTPRWLRRGQRHPEARPPSLATPATAAGLQPPLARPLS